MNVQLNSWCRRVVCWTFALVAAVSGAQGATDFNDVGKAMAILLQNGHFSRKELGDKISRDSLDLYLDILDPSRIFFTKKDVDVIRSKYGTVLDDYLFSGRIMQAAVPLYTLYCRRVEQRVRYVEELLKTEAFKFDRTEYVARSRRKVDRPRNEKELNRVWRDMIEEQLLTEILRRETISRLAREQNKPDPASSEKPPREKMLLRYDRLLRNLKETSAAEDVASILLNAVAQVYDPHTEYMSTRETESFKTSIGLSMVGIGILLAEDDDGSFKIDGIMVGSPADRSGELKLNDRIVAVDSNNSGQMTDVLFMPQDKVVDMIRGREGSRVCLKVEPVSAPGHLKDVSLVRAKVETREELARGEILEMKQPGGGTVKLGILILPSFYMDMDGGDRSCAADVKKILLRMVREGVEGLVVDLRDNGGGSLEEVVRMTGFFTGSGPVVQIRNRHGGKEIKEAWSTPVFKGQLVVLINKFSASASEIMAAALQDYGRAVIAGGHSSFGKGSVQVPFEVGAFLPCFSDSSRAGTLKMTIQKFYRVAGGSTQLKGVESDLVLPGEDMSYDVGEDKLDHAMPYDQIEPCMDYKKNAWIATILPSLRERSEQRVEQDRDLQIIREETALDQKHFEENRISINKEVREQENGETLNRRKLLHEECRKRFAEIAKADADRYKIYRLTLDDVEAGTLPQADPSKDNEQFMKFAENPTDVLYDTPEYPSGLDPELREGLNIVADMVDLKKGLPLAGHFR